MYSIIMYFHFWRNVYFKLDKSMINMKIVFSYWKLPRAHITHTHTHSRAHTHAHTHTRTHTHHHTHTRARTHKHTFNVKIYKICNTVLVLHMFKYILVTHNLEFDMKILCVCFWVFYPLLLKIIMYNFDLNFDTGTEGTL
jgi:hypothetical protein